MIPRIAIVFLALVVVLPGAAETGVCDGCVEARKTNGWCERCGVGYVGDVAIRSQYLWHTLDAHGHTLNVENLNCDGCTAAFESDGFCAESKIGFVDGEGYFSRLTWLLAKAERRTAEDLECPTCRGHAAGSGWCERCGIGRVGAYAFSDRADFDALVHDMRILELANEAAARCEHCAAAIVTDTQCPHCRIGYRDGVAATETVRP